MDNIRLIIAGSRDFNNPELLDREVSKYLFEEILGTDVAEIEIVSGGARGADKLGESYARLRYLPIKIFKADWNGKGRGAGHIRNEEMAKYANYCIIFNVSRSPGSVSMEKLAEKYNLGLKVINL